MQGAVGYDATPHVAGIPRWTVGGGLGAAF